MKNPQGETTRGGGNRQSKESPEVKPPGGRNPGGGNSPDTGKVGKIIIVLQKN